MKNIFKGIALVASVLAVSIVVGYAVLAWTEPGAVTPPAGNVAAPINTGSAAQGKTGSLGIGTTSVAPNSKLSVDGGGIKIGAPTANLDASLHIVGSYGGFDRLIQAGPSASNKPGLNLLSSRNAAGTNQWWSWGVTTDNKWAIQPGTVFSGSNGFFMDSTGNVGIGTAAPGTKLEVAGKVKINDGSEAAGKVLTSDANGLAGWASPSVFGTGSDQDCGANGYVTGLKADGKIVCGDKGLFDPTTPCSSGPLGGANKRIFVTSSTFDASTFVTSINNTTHVYASSETLADNKCQDFAYAGGMTTRNSTNNATGANAAIFKSIVYMGSRNITSVFPVAKIWSCDAGSATHWKQVANDMSDMFDSNGLLNRIYTQYGIASSANVWTDFKSDGNGGYTLIKSQVGNWGTYPFYGFGGNCLLGARSSPPDCSGWNCYTAAESWYGKADQTNAGWAYSGNFQIKDRCCYDLTNTWYACMGQSKALYCIEQ